MIDDERGSVFISFFAHSTRDPEINCYFLLNNSLATDIPTEGAGRDGWALIQAAAASSSTSFLINPPVSKSRLAGRKAGLVGEKEARPGFPFFQGRSVGRNIEEKQQPRETWRGKEEEVTGM